jgi:hypothetical protein
MSVRSKPRLHLSLLSAALAIPLFANIGHAQCSHGRGSSTRYSPGMQQLVQQQQLQQLQMLQQLQQQQLVQAVQLERQMLDLVKQGPEVLKTFLRDRQPEKRLLTAIAIGKHGPPELRDDLVQLLTDNNSLVRQAARRSLVSLSTWRDGKRGVRRGVDFGPAANASRAAQKAAVLKWQTWLDKQQETKTAKLDGPVGPGGR